MTDKAIYINNFPHPIHGSLQPLRLGGESNLKEGETMSDAWDRMHKEAVEWIRTRIVTSNPYSPLPEDCYSTKGLEVYPTYTTTIDYKKVEQLEAAIDNAASLEELDKLKADNPLFPARLLESFNKKRKELSDANS